MLIVRKHGTPTRRELSPAKTPLPKFQVDTFRDPVSELKTDDELAFDESLKKLTEAPREPKAQVTRPPTLYLTCGLPGSGKTTLAKRLEQEVPALRLTADEWLHELYPDITTSEAEAGPFRGRVERLQWPIAVRALELGCNVVLDWGVWAREERDLYRTGASEVGARVILCLFDPPIDELWNRLSRRNTDRPIGAFEITKAELLRWSELFQRPTADELALYDPWKADCPLVAGL